MSAADRGPFDETSGIAPARVLCVDDEQHVLNGLARVLSDQFEVVTCAGPIAALSRLEQDGDFAVVISDVNMPLMDGLTFLRQVQTFSPTTTRLVLTGARVVSPSGLPPEAVFRIIAKPCTGAALLEIVAEAANYHALIAAAPMQPIRPRLETPVLPSPAAARGLVPSREALPDLFRALTPPAIISGGLGPDESSPLPGRVGLRMSARTIELLPGLTIVGRSRTCHIPLDDPKVSRQHACFDNSGRELSVRNLSSTNRLLINGRASEGEEPRRLQVGDRVTVGSQELEVCALGDYCPSFEPTQRLSLGGTAAVAAATAAETPTLGKLAEIASKCARLGQQRDAERILRPLLDGLLRYCRSQQTPVLDDVRLAVELALGLAESSHVGEWISYIFALLSAVGLLPEADVLERLQRVIPTTPGISMATYRGYLDVLSRAQERFSPAQRFLVRRVQGLEAALMRSAHL